MLCFAVVHSYNISGHYMVGFLEILHDGLKFGTFEAFKYELVLCLLISCICTVFTQVIFLVFVRRGNDFF